MIIGGIQKFTLIDYPGKLAATIFLSGCNFKCPWCYSGELVLPEKIACHPKISENEVLEFLSSRKDRLEGVVLCGGEPTLNKELPYFAKKIKDLGFSVKLDTNGSNFSMLSELVNDGLVDYVAMDIKGPKAKYPEITGRKVDIKNIEKSVNFLKRGLVNYEFRTTIVPAFHKREDILEMAKWLSGADKYYLQNFRPEKTIDPQMESVKPYTREFINEMVQAISPFFRICQSR
jgi:pyruvate formate lyase activating enzyme